MTGADINRDAHGIDRQARVVLRAASGATARVELDWSYEGERKDVEVLLADGSTHRADMLRGYPRFTGSPGLKDSHGFKASHGFKESLWHEYLGILRDFEQALSRSEHGADGGLAALALVDSTYRAERERCSPPTPY